MTSASTDRRHSGMPVNAVNGSLREHPTEASGAVIAPFFVLNGDLRKPRMLEMLEQCVAAGFDGVFLHAREGLRTPYMSEAWLDAVDYCVKTAEELGLKSWLYDEFPYPSGVAAGKVLERNPNFAEQHLEVKRFEIRGGGEVVQVLGKGRLVAAFLVPAGPEGARRWNEAVRWDGAVDVTGAVGIRNTTWISRDWDSRHYYDQEFARLYQCRRSLEAFTEQVFQGHVPTGRWELIVFFKQTGGDFQEPFGHYVDVSNAEATRVFLEETHERYRSRLGDRFGKQIPGIFTDEPKYRNGLPWSDAIASEWTSFRKDRRALLALVSGNGWEAARKEYRCAASSLFLGNWVRPIRDWCHNAGIKLIGHISPEEDWWTESRLAGSILQHLREFSIPGCDLIIPAVGDRRHPVLTLTPTLAVSAAAQAGASQAMCEVFGCSDYSLDPQTVKRVADWLAVSGVNFFVPHACFYSLAGQRRFDAPPTFLPPMTLHRHLAEWSRITRGTAARLGPRAAGAGIALLRPMSSLFAMGEEEKHRADSLFRTALAVAQELLEKGLQFHWLDDFDLAECHISKGRLRFRRTSYDKLILFTEPADVPLQETLADARENGIEILDPAQAKNLIGPLECAQGDVRVLRDADADGVYFCVNLSPEPRRFLLEDRENHLEGCESRWIGESSARHARPSAKSSRMVSLGTQWKITPPATNACRLVNWSWRGGWHPVGPVSAALPDGMVPMVQMSIGLAPITPELPREVEVAYETTFESLGGPKSGVYFRIEPEGVTGDWSASLNNSPLEAWLSDEDPEAGIRHLLDPFLTEGRNSLRIVVKTSDARDGLLLPPYLSGPFEVRCERWPVIAPQNPSIVGEDWSTRGYPHFSGTMDFEIGFEGEMEPDDEAFLVFDPPPAGVVEVILNGTALGRLLWSPWRLPVGEALRPGANLLRLRVTNTLFNFVYGKPKPSGPLSGARIEVCRRKAAGAMRAKRPASAKCNSTE